MNKKLLAATLIFCVLGFMNPGVVSANPSIFVDTAQTATATSTQAYMTAGVGTTTLSVDTLSLTGSSDKINGGILAFQAQASTTLALSLIARLEYSTDNIDWYAVNLSPATSTSGYSTYSELVFQLASTSASGIGGSGRLGGGGVATRFHRALPVDFPTRYVRAVFYVPPGAPPVAIWAQFIPNKESSR